MKKSVWETIKEYQKEYKVERKEEFQNNSIVLSFAIAIIIIGIISIFYQTSDTLLIGIALSSLLLTMIQCFQNGNTMINILPIFTLLLFGFFDKSLTKIPIINITLREEYRNFIIFVSFSLTFLTQAYKNIKYKHTIHMANIAYNQEKNKMISNELEIIQNMKTKAQKIKRLEDEKSIPEEELKKSTDELLKYMEEETFISNVKSTLIAKGTEEKKVDFPIEEVEEAILLNSGHTRKREINAIEKE